MPKHFFQISLFLEYLDEAQERFHWCLSPCILFTLYNVTFFSILKSVTMVSTNSPVSTIFVFPVAGFLSASTKIVSEGLSCGRVLPNCLLFCLLFCPPASLWLAASQSAVWKMAYGHFYTSSVLSQVSPFLS